MIFELGHKLYMSIVIRLKFFFIFCKAAYIYFTYLKVLKLLNNCYDYVTENLFILCSFIYSLNMVFFKLQFIYTINNNFCT